MKQYVIIVSVFAALVGSAIYMGSIQSSASVVNPPTRVELLKLVNAERAKVGVAPLTEDARLDQSAQMKADDMLKNHYYSHISPVTGRQGYLYIEDTMGQYTCSYISENIDEIDTDDPTKITAALHVYSWMHSTLHREAMLNSRYTLTGFGIDGNLAVEHFCQLR
jgi:uncharacterized protein YkwD